MTHRLRCIQNKSDIKSNLKTLRSIIDVFEIIDLMVLKSIISRIMKYDDLNQNITIINEIKITVSRKIFTKTTTVPVQLFDLLEYLYCLVQH